MNRRGHLSSKIPNVKIRPAPPLQSASTRTRNARHNEEPERSAMDEEIFRQAWQGAEDEAASSAALRSTRKPLRGIVLTFTGVENKPALSEIVKELGGTVESALTVEVTHTVASGFGSPKYLYAVENRIPVLTPEWIRDVHERYLNGEDVDVDATISAHRLLPFLDLRIAITGMEDIQRRKHLIHWISEGGGVYSKDLDRSCTHLITAKSTAESKSSEKVKWALRELSDRDVARRRGRKVSGEDMKIVYEEWIWDCVAFDGRWKEDLYDARKARREGRVRAEDVIHGTIPEDVLRPPAKAKKAEPKTAPEAEDGPALLTKRKRDTVDLVGEIISTAGVKAESTVVPNVTDADATEMNPQHTVDESTRGTRTKQSDAKPSLLHASKVDAFDTTNAAAGPSRLFSTTSVPAVGLSAPSISVVPDQQDVRPIFAGLRFSHVIEEHAEGLEQALRLHGGTLISERGGLDGAEVDYVVVRLASSVRPKLPDKGKHPVVVTECWVEGCCFECRLLSPNDHLVFRPLPAPMPIEGADKLLVHLSGFSTSEGVYLKRLLRAIGGRLSVNLNRQSTHLVCAKPEGQKYERAHDWGLRVLRDEWLLEMGRSGRIEPEEAYRHPRPATSLASRLPRKNALLSAKTVSVSAMSTASELPEAFSEAKPQATSSLQPARSATLSVPPSSPSRRLKSIPTHLNDTTGDLVKETTVSIQRATTPLPLSAPQQETERKLNHASPRRAPSAPQKGSSQNAESVDSKVNRTQSAPEAGAAAESLGAQTLSKNTLVTEQLRKLAAAPALGRMITPPGRREIRRKRNSAPMRNNLSSSPFVTPPVTELASPPPTADLENADLELGLMGNKGYEDSMRVEYIDPAGVKERKRLWAAFQPNPEKKAKTSR